jgi:hypothetical protein
VLCATAEKEKPSCRGFLEANRRYRYFYFSFLSLLAFCLFLFFFPTLQISWFPFRPPTPPPLECFYWSLASSLNADLLGEENKNK